MIRFNKIFNSILLWQLRLTGYLLHSRRKSVVILSTMINIFHIVLLSTLMIGPLCIGFEYFQLYENDFWAVIGMAIHISCCCTILVCLGETIWNRKKHPAFLQKVSLLNKSMEESKIFQEKLRGAAWKYTIIFLVLLVLGFKIAAIKYETGPAQAIFYLYSFTMMLTRNFQFTVVIDLLRIHLEMIVLQIQNVVKRQRNNKDEGLVKETLLYVKNYYEKIYDVSSMINQYRGLSALFISSLYSVLIVGITYCRLVNFLKNVEIISNTEFILDLGGMVIALLTTVKSCQNVSDVIEKLLMNVHMLSNGDRNLALIQQISTEIDQNHIKFTAMGFYDINYKTLSSLFVTSIMYIMILVQFDPTPKKDQMFVIDHRKNWEKFMNRLMNLLGH